MILIENKDYDIINFKQYRLLKTLKIHTQIIPPEEKPVQTKFGYLTSEGQLSLYRGFIWDGATGAFDTDSILRASCIHDWFCNAVDNGDLPVKYRRKGDDLFYKIMTEDNVPEFRANYAYQAVVAWGQIKHAKD